MPEMRISPLNSCQGESLSSLYDARGIREKNAVAAGVRWCSMLPILSAQMETPVDRRAVLRPIVRFGVFEMDPQTGELRKRGVKVRLQGKPLQVLRALLEKPGQVVTREDLQRRLWVSDVFVDFES